MAENYIVIGKESEKIRGIAMYGELTEEKIVERRKLELCKTITAGLVEVDQYEPLDFIPIDK